MGDKNIFKVKLFLAASTPEDMVALQLANNRFHNIEFTYNIMMWKGGLLAWYQADTTKMRRDRDVV